MNRRASESKTERSEVHAPSHPLLNRSPRTTAFASLGLIVGAAALVLGLGLSRQPSDPPLDLSASIGVLDEGIWSHNAANDALYGRPRLDDFNPMVVTAGSWLYRASYALAGVGILQTRLPSIVLGTAAVLLVGLLLWREDRLAGILAAWLLASCYLFLAYSRLGLLETPAIAAALGGLACVVATLRRERPLVAAIGGVLVAAACTTKIQVIAPIGGAALALSAWYLLSGRRQLRVGRSLLFAAAGFTLVSVTWTVYVVTRLDTAARAEWAWHSSGVSPRVQEIPGTVWGFVRASDGFGTRARPLLIAAAVGLILQTVAWTSRRWRPGPIHVAALGWAVGGFLLVAPLPYHPSRYSVLVLPGLAMVAAGGIQALRSSLRGRVRTVAAAVALIGIATSALLGVREWARWSPTYDLRRTAGVLAQATGPGDVIIGGWALLPSLDAHRRVVIIRVPGINDRCPIERFGATWILMEHTHGDRVFYDRFAPGLLTGEDPVATASVLGHPLDLFRIPAGTPDTCDPRTAPPASDPGDARG